jgi:hypothetical protein
VPARLTAGIRVADDLSPQGTGRKPGGRLAKLALQQGNVQWTAAGSLVFSDGEGVTSRDEAGGTAAHPVPPVCGTIQVQADFRSKGCGFAGLALGRSNLASDFWKCYDLLAFLTPKGSYAVLLRGDSLAKGDSSAYPGFRPDGFNRLALEYNSLAQTVTVSINQQVVLKAADLSHKNLGLAITAAGFRFNERVMADAPAVKDYSAEVTAEVTSGLVPAKLEDFFILPEQPTTLAWNAAARGRSDPLRYEVQDYCGELVRQGIATVGADGEVRASLPGLTRGYYEIHFPECRESFGLAALEPQEGAADPLFCIDAGLSWLETRETKRPGLVAILRRSGIAMARERLSCGSVNPDRDLWKWDEKPRNYVALRKLYAGQHVPILEILDGGARHWGMVRNCPYPTNLVEVANTFTTLAKEFQIYWGGAEIWNEPDLKPLPADQYVPLAKATAYALRRGRIAAPIVGGVYATVPPGPFYDACAANGMLDQVDCVSFHSYDRAPDIQAMVARYRNWLKTAGKETMPLWLTECGLPWDLGPSRPPREQDAISALEITMKGVEARACGIARYFPFVYTFYEEGGIKSFSMMGREVTPLRSMAGYVFAARTLAHKTYLGDLEHQLPAVKLARVFAAGAQQRLVVLYTGKPDPAATVALDLPAGPLAGIDGRPLARTATGAIPIPDGMVYAWVDAAAIAGRLKTDTPAMALYAVEKRPPPTRAEPSPIILQHRVEKSPGRSSAQRYLIDEATAAKLTVAVRIHNLSEHAERVIAQLHLPGPENPGKVRAADPVEVPAQGAADVNWTVDALSSLDVAQTRFITITARGDKTVEISPLAIPLVVEGSLETHLRRHSQRKPLPIGELQRWQPMIAGHGKMTMSAPDGHWQMDVSFTKSGGAWAYPRFVLPEPLSSTPADGLLIRARSLQPGRSMAIMLDGEPRESFWAMDIMPADGAWHVAYLPFAEFRPAPGHPDLQNARLDLKRIQRMGIGMSTNVPKNTLEVSDLIVVGGVSEH